MSALLILVLVLGAGAGLIALIGRAHTHEAASVVRHSASPESPHASQSHGAGDAENAVDAALNAPDDSSFEGYLAPGLKYDSPAVDCLNTVNDQSPPDGLSYDTTDSRINPDGTASVTEVVDDPAITMTFQLVHLSSWKISKITCTASSPSASPSAGDTSTHI